MLFLAMEYRAAQARPALSDDTCESLLAAIAQEDTQAFEDLYRLTARSVYAYALSLTRNTQDAQDAMMEAYLAIRGGAGRYQAQGKPLAWIFTIVRNAVRMLQRPSQRTLSLDEQPLMEPSEAWDPEAALVLREALSILPDDAREIVLLHAVSGLKHREIAAALNLPLSTVLSKYARALQRLRRHLDANEEGDVHGSTE